MDGITKVVHDGSSIDFNISSIEIRVSRFLRLRTSRAVMLDGMYLGTLILVL